LGIYIYIYLYRPTPFATALPTAIGTCTEKLIKIDRACVSGDNLADRQIDIQTDVLITILRHL